MSGPDTHDDEAVYDAYLAASAAGRAEAPEAVFTRHPGLGEEVRSRIEGLWLATSLREVGPPAPREMDRLGPFRLVERLDSGGMGTVFRAIRDPDGAEFAVKVLRPELAGSATAAERLRREALALSRVRHGSVVRVHGFAEDRGVSYLVLELVRGRGLDEVLSEAASRGEFLDPARIARWGAALARGLQAAHDEGVIHRDVKPSNIRLRPDDSPLLLDFGIATVPDRTPGALTASFAGSPFYAAPEQLMGTRVDGRADVYGLCATLYQCLTGRVPFAGDRFDEVMRRVLVEPPIPLRRLAPRVPAALETVVLAGLEKDPERRPPSATALAEDVEAAVAGAPIRARRAGAARRLVGWGRARPLAAAAAVLAGLAAVGLPTSAWLSRRAEEARVLVEARGFLWEAERDAASYATGLERGRAIEESALDLRRRLISGWLPDAQLDHLGTLEEGLSNHRRDRDAAFHGILSRLERAERLSPGLEGIAACRAKLYLQRWKEATAAGDTSGMALYRALVERADPGGPANEEFARISTLQIHPDPPDAEVHLFRVALRSDLLPGGGQRFVPVPLRGFPEGAPPAPWALRVVRGAGEVPEGEHLLRVAGRSVEEDPAAAAKAASAGGARATLWRDGALVEADLPAGLEVRVTAAPLLPCAGSLVGRGPQPSIELPPGEYAVLLRASGRLDTREAANIAGPVYGRRIEALLPRPEDRPPGCVRVASPEIVKDNVPVEPYWIRESETTAAEYLEFLNDAATLAAIDASPRPILVPRHEVDPPLWRRGEDGRFSLPAGTTPSHPVLGVSFDDAVAYARWLTGRCGARGERWAWRLPTFDEWLNAAGSSVRRAFPFGPRFQPRWASTCYSKPAPAPEPVRSYPVDESVYGIYDACGGAMEWVDDWYDRPRGLRRLAGGSWAQGNTTALYLYAPRGARPDRADREFGIRLVAEERKP